MKIEPATKIVTPNGIIDIYKPEKELLKRLQYLLPFGIMSFTKTTKGADYGFVMCCGEQEVYCIKQQPIEVDREQAELRLEVQHYMIVDAYCRYLKSGFSGAYLAAPYLRQRDNGLWEAGVSHFIFPDDIQIKSSFTSFIKLHNFRFGKKANKMLIKFAKCFREAFDESKLPMPVYFGLDDRPRSHLQNLAMNFMVLDQDIICLRANLREDEDVSWAIMSSAGINKIYHLPSLPMTIEESDLSFAKGQ